MKLTPINRAKEAHNRQTDWEKRIEVLTLKNQGWSFRKIAKKHDTSHNAVYEMYEKIKDSTIEELEVMREKYEK